MRRKVVFLILLFSYISLFSINTQARDYLVNTTYTLSNNHIVWWEVTIDSSKTYNLEWSSSHYADLLCLDASNFNSYRSAFQSLSIVLFEYYIVLSALNSKSHSMEFSPETTEVLYFVVENADFIYQGAPGVSSLLVDFEIYVEGLNSGETAGIVIGVIALAAIFYVIGLEQRRRARRQIAEELPILSQTPESNDPEIKSKYTEPEKPKYVEKLAGNFCPSCGKQLSKVETFCSNCGVQVR